MKVRKKMTERDQEEENDIENRRGTHRDQKEEELIKNRDHMKTEREIKGMTRIKKKANWYRMKRRRQEKRC